MGHNLPCDLHNEHVKSSITYMVSVSAWFDQQCKVIESSVHTTCEDFDDVKHVVGVVMRENLWEIHKGHKYRKFKVLSTVIWTEKNWNNGWKFFSFRLQEI